MRVSAISLVYIVLLPRAYCQYDAQADGSQLRNNDLFNPFLPNLLFIGTGGTIAGVVSSVEQTTEYQSGVIGIGKLIEEVPEVHDRCNVRYMQAFNVDSININSTILLILSEIIQLVLNLPFVDGVIVTIGTDTLPTSGHFLDSTIYSEKPVVLTGAIRPSTTRSADGPMNLMAAALVASSTSAWNRGVLVSFNNRIDSASNIMKEDFASLDAFGS
ncbi:Asparaginase/glutaminase [Ilyonectria sp. MPI-CAGE-AT-0026]|nr:Asparaginase/glutaminase [Ilyonectria sp. MPI-CAGE-AT-0026]